MICTIFCELLQFCAPAHKNQGSKFKHFETILIIDQVCAMT